MISKNRKTLSVSVKPLMDAAVQQACQIEALMAGTGLI
jgi:hypothetical protein